MTDYAQNRCRNLSSRASVQETWCKILRCDFWHCFRYCGTDKMKAFWWDKIDVSAGPLPIISLGRAFSRNISWESLFTTHIDNIPLSNT